MKTMKKLAGLLLALVMALAMAAPAMAAQGKNASLDTATCEITIEMPYGIDKSAENTYEIYRVFDAFYTETDAGPSHIRYKLLGSGEPYTNLPGYADGFQIMAGDFVGFAGAESSDGYLWSDSSASEPVDLPPDSVSGLGRYVKDCGIEPAYVVRVRVQDEVYTVEGQTTGGGAVIPEDQVEGTGAKISISVTPGYYYISTTTGSAVWVNSLAPEANVTDKNEVPQMTKVITDALYQGEAKEAIVQAGDTVYFSLTIDVAKGAMNYVLHDTMDKGLKYNEDSMEVTVTSVGEDGTESTDTLAPGKDGWTLTTAADSETGGSILTVAFYDDEDPDTPNVIPNDVARITVHYSATVTSDSLSKDPAANTAYVSYGNENKTTEDTVRVYNAKVTVNKVDGTSQPLAGAKFKLKNDQGQYYKAVTAPDGSISIEWGPNGDEVEAKLVEGKYAAEFKGLGAGIYTLEESTVPNGYNKAGDVVFKVYDVNETITEAGTGETRNWDKTDDLEVEHTVVNQAGRELPDTGGVGTTVFTIAGGTLMLGAAVLFITKKRSNGD